MQIMQLSGRRKGEGKGTTSAKVLCGTDLAHWEQAKRPAWLEQMGRGD